MQSPGWARSTQPSMFSVCRSMNTKFAWELNTVGLTSDLPPDRNIYPCTSVLKVMKTEMDTVGLGPL
ncbi:hypothetical protein TNCV_1088881 [Trichonephila clavipes]|uniref:Uncharacterized protein n=1 Tax=Trichonephila clavipes TaxID=2585209 RepID=A0A8X6SX67_TRICX|nr:hypothetical protein TNCV_1088881 [Trichonephila clavipes]